MTLSSNGDTAYIADFDGGLEIVSVTDPTNPVPIGSYHTTQAYGVTLSADETIAYVANGAYGLSIIDIQDLATPMWLAV